MEKKRLKKDEIKEIERQVVPEEFLGKHEWPIKVQVLGQTARLRLVRNKKRIYFDWQVPAEYRGVFERARFYQQVPQHEFWKPEHEDRGRNPDLAIGWLKDWLKERLTQALVETGEDQRHVPGMPKRTRLPLLIERFRKSDHFMGATASERKTWERWLDFLQATLGPDFFLDMVSPDVLSRLHSAYQAPWKRRLKGEEDEEVEVLFPGAGPNTAAKVVRFFKTVCLWGIAEPDGQGGFLLEKDPFARIRPRDMPKENVTVRRVVGTASEEYATALIEDLRGRGEAGQALLVFGTEAALGRRPGEVRLLRRHHLLTTPEEIAEGLRTQACRRVLPDKAIPEEEIEDAAAAYAERGFAIHFDAGKQLASDPNAAQHDRVVPAGKRLTAVLRDYLDVHWDPLGLGPEDWLCPSSSDPTEPTSRHVADQWFKRTKRQLERREGGPRVPPGQSHTLRHRFRTVHRNEPGKLAAFVAGWSLRQPSAMDSHYLPVLWQDIVKFIDRIDETTASVL